MSSSPRPWTERPLRQRRPKASLFANTPACCGYGDRGRFRRNGSIHNNIVYGLSPPARPSAAIAWQSHGAAKSTQFYGGNLVNHRSNRRKLLSITFALRLVWYVRGSIVLSPLLKLADPLTPCMFWFMKNVMIIFFVYFRWQLEPCRWHPRRQSTQLSRFIVKTLTWAPVRRLLCLLIIMNNNPVVAGWLVGGPCPVTGRRRAGGAILFLCPPSGRSAQTNTLLPTVRLVGMKSMARVSKQLSSFFTTVNNIHYTIICVTFAIWSRHLGGFVS